MILSQAIDRLVAIFETAVSVPVFDTPDPYAITQRQFVAVATDGEDEEGATVDLASSDLGPGGWHDETGEIVCSTWAWKGGNDLSAARADALALAEACVTAVRADRKLGGLIAGAGVAEPSEVTYRALQTESGPICRFTFTVTYSHLLT